MWNSETVKFRNWNFKKPKIETVAQHLELFISLTSCFVVPQWKISSLHLPEHLCDINHYNSFSQTSCGSGIKSPAPHTHTHTHTHTRDKSRVCEPAWRRRHTLLQTVNLPKWQELLYVCGGIVKRKRTRGSAFWVGAKGTRRRSVSRIFLRGEKNVGLLGSKRVAGLSCRGDRCVWIYALCVADERRENKLSYSFKRIFFMAVL